MNRKIIILLLFINTIGLFSFTRVQEDSLWDFENLKEKDFKPDYSFNYKYNHGWFPAPFPNNWDLGVFFEGGDVYDLAAKIRSVSFVQTAFPFSNHDPYLTDERKIVKSTKKDDFQTDFPSTGYSNFGIHFAFSYFIPVTFSLFSSIRFNDGILFSPDETKSYLNYDGTIKYFKEVGVAYLEETMLDAGFGIKLPVYGLFYRMELDSEKISLASSYYLKGNFSVSLPLAHKFTQYMQIADAKNDLRYYNTSDTMRLLSETGLKTINKTRMYADIALGTDLIGNNIGVSFEMFLKIPLNSVVKDAVWKQYVFGFRIEFILSGLLKKKIF